MTKTEMATDLASLDVRLHGQSVGTLARLPDDKTLFAFSQEYIENPDRPTLSLSFKDTFGKLIAGVAPAQTRLPPFFSNLLPEGSMRDYLARRAQVKPQREFYLMWALGRDLSGATRIVHENDESLPPADADNDAAAVDQRSSAEDVLRFSLAGVEMKFSAIREASGGLTIPADGVGGSWIVKLPSTRYAHVPENEFAIMELARRTGIDVPETRLIPVSRILGLPTQIDIAGALALSVKRFDRGPDGESIHMEDFAQVFGLYPERKYERASYRSVARVLWTETGEPGIAELVRRLVFSALIGNADMHLKNLSLIYPDRVRATLSPAYDLVSTIVYLHDEKMALSFVDSKAFASVSLEEFERFAAKAGVPRKPVLECAATTVEAFSKAWSDMDGIELDDSARQTIAAHLETVPLWGQIRGRGSRIKRSARPGNSP